MIISLVAAAGENNVIGSNNGLPWRMPEDIKFFKDLTTGHTVIMGRKTFFSFGKPLKDRKNIIVTREHGLSIDGCMVVNSLDEALMLAKGEQEVFIIGGSEIYKQAMDIADKIYLTRIHADFQGDAFFPVMPENQWEESYRKEFPADEKNPYPFAFLQYKKIIKVNN